MKYTSKQIKIFDSLSIAVQFNIGTVFAFTNGTFYITMARTALFLLRYTCIAQMLLYSLQWVYSPNVLSNYFKKNCNKMVLTILQPGFFIKFSLSLNAHFKPILIFNVLKKAGYYKRKILYSLYNIALSFHFYVRYHPKSLKNRN